MTLLPIVRLSLLVLLVTGCSSRAREGGSAALGAATGSAAGIRWSVPAQWSEGPERPMRTATYSIPSPGTEPAECAVFFFGQGQGGDVDSNLQRWLEQFEQGARASRSSVSVNGLSVTRVEIEGRYLAPAGPRMESQGSKPGWRLLGAIVEAPAGRVFFKSTGPARALDAARPAFDALIGSVRRVELP